MISVAWIVISLVGITRTFLIKRRLYFSNEEELFLKSGMPCVPREVARKILDAGNWITLEPETYLTHEGQPVDHLYFISSGTAGVFVMGNEVAALHEGCVGELNELEAGPASAAVKTLEKIIKTLSSSPVVLTMGPVAKEVVKNMKDVLFFRSN